MKSNKKQVIRLTESDLHNVIKESVKKVLRESLDTDDSYFKWMRSKYPEGKQGDIAYSWNALKDSEPFTSKEDPESTINPYPQYGYHNKERLHTLDRMKDYHSDWQRGDHAYYEDGSVYPSAEWCDSKFDGTPAHYSKWAKDADNVLAHDDFDKQMAKFKERDNIDKLSKSRPLHRKGSLNREL